MTVTQEDLFASRERKTSARKTGKPAAKKKTATAKAKANGKAPARNKSAKSPSAKPQSARSKTSKTNAAKARIAETQAELSIPEPPAGKERDYTAKDIEVLEGLEPVRRRPGMSRADRSHRGLVFTSTAGAVWHSSYLHGQNLHRNLVHVHRRVAWIGIRL